jgi:hypothetical protein
MDEYSKALCDERHGEIKKELNALFETQRETVKETNDKFNK